MKPKTAENDNKGLNSHARDMRGPRGPAFYFRIVW